MDLHAEQEKMFERKRAKNKVSYNVRLRKYKLSLKEYSLILEQQKEKCAICDDFLYKPQIDHCHTLNHVRGILCCSCNTALGLFKEKVEFLKRAIKYLNTNKSRRAWWIQQADYYYLTNGELNIKVLPDVP